MGRGSFGEYDIWANSPTENAQGMKIVITIRDTDDGQISVSETRELDAGESEDTVTSATALADAMFEVMDHLGEVEEPA